MGNFSQKQYPTKNVLHFCLPTTIKIGICRFYGQIISVGDYSNYRPINIQLGNKIVIENFK